MSHALRPVLAMLCVRVVLVVVVLTGANVARQRLVGAIV
jgi:hypothetical protein